MNIKFKKITLDNFLSFQHCEINLSNNGYTLVSGINKNPDDMAKSNGSGKSSIWEGISFALTGETIRGTKNVTNIYSDGKCEVTLQFNVDKDEYIVTRTKDPSNLFIYVNGENKSGKGIRDTEKILHDILPDITSSLLGSVIILGQGLPQRFTNNTPSGRKEVLEKLSKSDFMLEDLKSRVENRSKDLNQQKANLHDESVKLDTSISMQQQVIDKNKALLDELSSIDISDVRNGIQVQKIVLESHVCDINRNQESLDKDMSRLSDNNNNITVLSQQIAEIESNISKRYAELQTPLNTDLIDVKSEIKTLQKSISDKKNITDVCPTCGQKLPNVFKPDTKEEEERLEDLTNRKHDIEMSLQKLDEKKTVELSEQRGEVQTKISILKGDISFLQQEINTLQDRIKESQGHRDNVLAQINKDQALVETFDLKQKTYTDEISAAEEKKKNDSSRLQEVNDAIEEINSRQQIIQKFKTSLTRDFRGFLLENVVRFIESKCKQYCKEVFNTDSLCFYLDGNNIAITYCNKEYETLSGGEKQKVDLIVQFAIRDMLCNFLGFSSNILVLDELFDNLDEVGCDKILNLIANNLQDVDSIYIVTHHTDISIPYDRGINIVKDENGISHVEE